jgi:acyl-CoA thioesterase-1
MFHPRIQGFLAAVLAGFALSATADTLLIVGAVPISSGDAQVVSELQALGQPVTVILDASSTTASANGRALVVISNSVAPGKVGNKFNQVAAPVIAFEPGVYDNLGLTGPVSGTDFGGKSDQSQIRMSGTHPLTAGLSGLVTVGTSPAKFSWGKPGASAVIAATLKSTSARATIFGYEAGASLANGTSAPARRIAIHLNDGATDAWNANGRTLFGAAVNWALGGGPSITVARILPLGDSITKGKNGHWSYRRDLELALQGADCSFDFIGKQSGPSSGPGTALVDRNHEGHSGFRTDEILASLSWWLNGNVPDWALVHIGTNDVLQGTSIAAARANVSGIIDKLRNANPNVGILLAQVIPNLPGNESAVVTLNDELASLAAQKNSQASPVILVDHYSGYSTFTHNYDQIHPNDAGEGFMAQRWFEALYPRIAESCGQ